LLTSKLRDSHARLVYTLAHTGLLWGEAAGLKVSAVDISIRVAMGRRCTVDGTVGAREKAVVFPKGIAFPEKSWPNAQPVPSASLLADLTSPPRQAWHLLAEAAPPSPGKKDRNMTTASPQT
jgi:hypothetical protein